MKRQPRALHYNHCAIYSARVWSAPPWRARSRTAGELLNYGSAPDSFTRAVPKDASSTVSVASGDVETIMNKPLAIPTPKGSKNASREKG